MKKKTQDVVYLIINLSVVVRCLFIVILLRLLHLINFWGSLVFIIQNFLNRCRRMIRPLKNPIFKAFLSCQV